MNMKDYISKDGAGKAVPSYGRGFTLIELLLVVAIIAIIAAAVIIAINPGQQFQQARNATRWSHMNAIVNGVYSYVLEEGSFPGCVGASATSVSNCEGDLVPVYLPTIPVDPLADGQYQIRFAPGTDSSRIELTVPDGASSDGATPTVVQ